MQPLPGCFVAGLEYSTGCTAEVVGKPEKAFFRAAMEAVRAEEGGMEDLREEGEVDGSTALPDWPDRLTISGIIRSCEIGRLQVLLDWRIGRRFL